MTLQEWVKQAYAVLHPAYKANLNHGVSEHWLAGLVYVECSSLNPKASRFEESVWQSVETVKNVGKSTMYPGFNSGPIKDFITKTDDPAKLRTIATSYGLGQIMGYNYLNKYGWYPDTYTDLSVNMSVKATLMMMADGREYAKTYEELLRWWNTGSIHGTTYSTEYVPNATAAMEAYQQYAAAAMTPTDVAPGQVHEITPSSTLKVSLADIESKLEELSEQVRTLKASI